MAFTLPTLGHTPTFGESFAGGIGDVLENLASQKLHEMHNKKLASNLSLSIKGMGIVPPGQEMHAATLILQNPSLLKDFYAQGQAGQERSRVEELLTGQNIPGNISKLISGLGPKERSLALQNLPALMELVNSNQSPTGMNNQQAILPQDIQQGQFGSQQQGLPSVQQGPGQPQGKSQAQLLANLFTPPAEKRANEQLDIQKEQLELSKKQFENKVGKEARDEKIKHQEHIDKVNTPVNTNADKTREIGNDIIRIASDMLSGVESGKVSSGILGRLTPEVLMSEENKTYLKNSEELANLFTQGTGPSSQFKIKAAQRRKPSLEDPKGTQLHLLKKIIQKGVEMKLPSLVRDDLIAMNDYKQPANLSTKINELIPSYKKLYKQADPSKYQEGTIIEESGKDFILRDNEWHYMGAAQ